MTDPTTILPGAAEPALLRVQSTSKLAFGATTAALVALASGGTAVVVAHGTSALSSPTALPSGKLLTGTPSAPGSVVVDRAPGSYVQAVQAARRATPPATVDQTEEALRKALAERPPTGKRTLTAPLVELPRAQLPDPPPVVVVPDPQVPVVAPPVVAPPVVPEVPVHTPRVPRPAPPAQPIEKPSNGGHDDRADKKADKKAEKSEHKAGHANKAAVAEEHPGQGKHARSGRHAR